MSAGLDLGRASLKLVRRDRKGRLQVAEQAIDASLTGQARTDALIAALDVAREAVGLARGAEVNVAVPRAFAIVKHLSLPEVAPAELPDLLRFQAAKALPFALSEMALTWGELGPDPLGGKRYVLAAVRETTLTELRDLVIAGGLKPARLEVSSQAAARMAPAVGEVLLVDVGHATSDVLLVHDGELRFSRSASVGLGSAGGAERLPQEVARSLIAGRAEGGHSEPERAEAPTKLLIAGGGASDPALAKALSQRVGCPCVPLAVEGVSDAAQAARLVVACGLIQAPLPGIPYLDLAQRAEARATQQSRQRATLGTLAGAALLIGAIVAGGLYVDAKAQAVETMKAEREALAPSLKRAKALQSELRVVRQWDARKGRELEALLAVVRSLPEDDEAYLSELRWTDGRGIILRGRAKSASNVESFFSRLESEPLVGSATVEQISRPREKNARGVDFAGQARLLQPGGKKAAK